MRNGVRKDTQRRVARYETIQREYLVVIFVAERHAESVDKVPDGEIWHHSVGVDRGVESERVAGGVDSVHLREPLWVLVGVEACIAVDEGVVPKEEGFTRRGLYIHHGASDSVVAEGVVAYEGTSGESSIVWVVAANVDVFLVAILGEGAITVARQAMRLVG